MAQYMVTSSTLLHCLFSLYANMTQVGVFCFSPWFNLVIDYIFFLLKGYSIFSSKNNENCALMKIIGMDFSSQISPVVGSKLHCI